MWFEVSCRTKERVDNLFGEIAMQCFMARDKFVSMKENDPFLDATLAQYVQTADR